MEQSLKNKPVSLQARQPAQSALPVSPAGQLCQQAQPTQREGGRGIVEHSYFMKKTKNSLML